MCMSPLKPEQKLPLKPEQKLVFVTSNFIYSYISLEDKLQTNLC